MLGAEWWLYGRKAKNGTCTIHYEGTWQPRRNGSLGDCVEQMHHDYREFDAFWLVLGTQETHERPPS